MPNRQNKPAGGSGGSKRGRQSGGSRQSGHERATGASGRRSLDDPASVRGSAHNRESKLNPLDEAESDIEPVSEREFIEDIEEQEVPDEEEDEEEAEEK